MTTKTITYNPETHVLVPREPNHNWCAGCSPDNCSGCGDGPVAKTKREAIDLAMGDE